MMFWVVHNTSLLFINVWFSYYCYICLHGQVLPGGSSVKQYPSSGPTGRSQIVSRVPSGAIANEPAKGAASDPLIGKKVRTRWPDDNNFYEAVITDYNPVEVRSFAAFSYI